MTAETARVAHPAHQRTQQEWEQVEDVAGMAYLSEGQGVPVLFLHGIGGAGRQWALQLRHLAPRFHAVAPDLPGYGGSVPLEVVTIDAMAASIGLFIRTLGLDRPVIVGHSLGGMLALRLLAEAPHIARGLVLSQSSAAFGGRDPAWAEKFVHDSLAPLDAGKGMPDLAAGLVRAMVGEGADPEGMALAADCLAATPDSTYRDTILAMPGFDRRDVLPRIAVPTLVLAGDADRAAPPDGVARMAARIPGARFESVAGAGHLLHLERPGVFNGLLDGFLAQF